MSPAEQDAAIAKACSWIPDHINRHAAYYVPDKDIHVGFPTRDLNAMHEAEKVLTEAQQDTMNNLLWDAMGGKKYLWHATAAQRAEAFLRTLNLWTEDT